MADQRELPLSFPELSPQTPFIPVRMVNEFVYCPRLAYLEWVQGEFAHSADTIEGAIKHKRVDKESGSLPESPEAEEKIHARSVTLSSTRLGITAKLDLVEGEGIRVVPVDYKRGKRPHVAAGAYDPERVQICAQGLLLREHGFDTDEGIIYFAGSKERVRVPFDETLVEQTLAAIQALRGLASGGQIPPPLEDSPKCPRCSLVGICLPDEVRFLNTPTVQPRPLFPALQSATPLYVQSPRAYIRKDGERFVIEVEREAVAEARIGEVSQVAVFGSTSLTAGALHVDAAASLKLSFRINPRRPYQALDQRGYEVELLVAPSLFRTLPKDDAFSPMAVFHEQEWLLQGRPVRHVVASRDGRSCPIFAPDPRWMGVHKLWLAQKPERNAAKKPKDLRQGNILLKAAASRMQSAYPMDTDFVMDLPEELRTVFDEWARANNFAPGRDVTQGMR